MTVRDLIGGRDDLPQFDLIYSAGIVRLLLQRRAPPSTLKFPTTSRAAALCFWLTSSRASGRRHNGKPNMDSNLTYRSECEIHGFLSEVPGSPNRDTKILDRHPQRADRLSRSVAEAIAGNARRVEARNNRLNRSRKHKRAVLRRKPVVAAAIFGGAFGCYVISLLTALAADPLLLSIAGAVLLCGFCIVLLFIGRPRCCHQSFTRRHCQPGDRPNCLFCLSLVEGQRTACWTSAIILNTSSVKYRNIPR